ncbi:MAG TPA: hypothetical protein VEF07_05130 [Candidatus Binataceae bacterium]|nr:hypothetical protein [Candidatus Binataceae bacterium]
MISYKGGNPAKDGFYWKKGEWEIVTVEGANGKLPGGTECEYIKVPGLLFVPAAIALSVPFVIFLPFIGFAMLFVLAGRKVGGRLGVACRALAERLAHRRAVAAETAGRY